MTSAIASEANRNNAPFLGITLPGALDQSLYQELASMAIVQIDGREALRIRCGHSSETGQCQVGNIFEQPGVCPIMTLVARNAHVIHAPCFPDKTQKSSRPEVF